MTADLAAAAPSTVAVLEPTARAAARAAARRRQFEAMVEAGQGGDPGRRGVPGRARPSGSTSSTARPTRSTSTGCCASSNPSPYMYLLRLPAPDGAAYDVVGSSPEALVKVTGRRVITHPIAGSRPAGRDARGGRRLRRGPAGRRQGARRARDAGRPGPQRPRPGLRAPAPSTCVDFMSVERYSHIMHIVSTVVGDSATDQHARTTCCAATFPAGTLSGAPKPRAMELIDELEPSRRGLYGGVVGYLDFAGDLDMAIAIRTAVIRDGRRLRPGRRRDRRRLGAAAGVRGVASTRRRPSCARWRRRPGCERP